MQTNNPIHFKLIEYSLQDKMKDRLNIIKDRFPHWSSVIDPLYRKNTSFHSLCDDYILVFDQIDQSSSLDVTISSADLVELKTLLKELEQEMIIFFKEAQTA